MISYITVSMVDSIARNTTVTNILHYVFCVVNPLYIGMGALYFIGRVSKYFYYPEVCILGKCQFDEINYFRINMRKFESLDVFMVLILDPHDCLHIAWNKREDSFWRIL